MEGSLNGFTFLDPLGNLLSCTEELDEAIWERDPLLNLSGGVADPLGGRRGWTLTNTGVGPQSLVQTINAPASYLYCFSLFARSTTASSVNLIVGSNRVERNVRAEWARFVISAAGNPTANSIPFGIEIPAGSTIDIFGSQVEPQPSASGYKYSMAGGVYEGARFRDDTFMYTTTDLNRNSATVNILYAEHL